MLRFSLASLLATVALVAVGSAALAHASDIWRQITMTFTVTCLLLATLAAVFSRGQVQRFAAGFALVGWVYMMLAFVSAFGLRDDLLTDKAIQWLGEVTQPEQRASMTEAGLASTLLYAENQKAGDFSNSDYLVASLSSNGTLALRNAPRLQNLTTIGHALWALIVGWLGGVVALWLRRQVPREHQTAD